jgi:hypothetical protein
VNVDLKSYAKDSIKSTGIASAANSLILAMDCVNRSSEWRWPSQRFLRFPP